MLFVPGVLYVPYGIYRPLLILPYVDNKTCYPRVKVEISLAYGEGRLSSVIKLVRSLTLMFFTRQKFSVTTQKCMYSACIL